MLIVCPKCDQKFSAPDGVLGKTGRRVRCKKCLHVWHQPPETDIPSIHTNPLPDAHPSSLSGPDHHVHASFSPRRVRLGLVTRRVLWGLSAIMIVLTGIVLARDPLVRVFPAVRPVFQAVHLLSPDQRWVEILDTRITQTPDGHLLHFQLHNTARTAVSVSHVDVKAMGPDAVAGTDAKGVLKTWKTAKIKGIMTPDQKTSFTVGPLRIPPQSTAIQLQLKEN